MKAGTKLVAHPYRAYFKFVPTEELNFTPAASTMRMIIGGKEGGAMEIQEVIAPEQVEGAAFGSKAFKNQNIKITINNNKVTCEVAVNTGITDVTAIKID